MTDQVVNKSGPHATKLVWVVTLLGFGAGLVLLGIVYSTMSGIRSQRERLDALQVEMTRMVTSLDPHFAQGRDEMGALLLSNGAKSGKSSWINNLTSLIQNYRNRGVVDSPSMSKVFDLLDTQLGRVKQIWDGCSNWNHLNKALVSNFPAAKKRIEKDLQEMRATISSIEGRESLAGQIIGDMSHVTDIPIIKTELADLSLLCERLVGESEIDNLADLKDNKFKSTLDRLDRGMRHLEKRKVLPTGLPITLLKNFEVALFGEGFKVDKVHQTILPCCARIDWRSELSGKSCRPK